MTTEATPKTRHRRMSRKKKILIICAVLLAAISATGYYIKKVMSEPSVGEVVSSLPAMTRPTPIELKQFDGTSFSFVLPVTYVEQIVKPDKNAPASESYTFVSTSMSSKMITATISKLPSGKLEDDPSYLMRTQDPNKYQLKPAVLKNEKVMISTTSDSQQFQQTAFWVHEGRLLTFTMAGAANNAQSLTAEYQDMIGTISWR